jgi:dTDP-D-glucose 4,6-dehydratase
MSNLEIIHEIGNLMLTMYPGFITDPPRIEFVTDRKGHDRNYFLDCDIFKRDYKVETTPFHEAMRETIDYYVRKYNV